MDSNIQKKIDHVIVLMLENRSFDNLVGWLYDENNQPQHFLPDNDQRYNGLSGVEYSNPLDLHKPDSAVKISKGVSYFQVPNPVPNEEFKNINQQLFGLNINKSVEGWLPREPGAKPSMQGFLADYVTATCSNKKSAHQIMQTYAPEDINVLSELAKHYAISDNYHASTPTQTWPNRAFMHAGTSNGKVNNFPYIPYANKTIFNVFEDEGYSWKVYKASKLIPSLTRIQMRQLWNVKFENNFNNVSHFIEDVSQGNLPAYSFIEPTYVLEKGDTASSEHPPADVCAGDLFLQKICNAVINSPVFDRILFIINYDEHGGCPDHVPPNWTAVAPDAKSQPGQLGFTFNRYGVRVPALFISPHIAKSSCIRASDDPWNWANSKMPFDHTSILAMLLDWKKIDRKKLPSERVQKQPENPFDELLSGTLRSDRPQFKATCVPIKQSIFKRIKNFIFSVLGICAEGYSLSSLQRSILVADCHYRKAQSYGFKADVTAPQDEVDELLRTVKTEAHMHTHFRSLSTDPEES